MRVVIAGGHGQIALLLAKRLAGAGHQPVGMIRNPDQAEDLRAAGAEPLTLDLESADAEQVAQALLGADAVVFAAGAGPNSGAERKLTLDRDGAILVARAAQPTPNPFTPARLLGYGRSLWVQGGFLLVFDAIMSWVIGQ